MDRHHVWSKIDIPLKATGAYRNPYTEVEVWVDPEGPGFARRIYGFWDGGIDFVARVMATAPGIWRWRSGSTPADAGLAGKSGTFEAVPWSEAELAENPNRRGMVVATPDGRGLQYADGTPFFLFGDTWWAVPSFRFRSPKGSAETDRQGGHVQRLRPLREVAGLQFGRRSWQRSRIGPATGSRRASSWTTTRRRYLVEGRLGQIQIPRAPRTCTTREAAPCSFPAKFRATKASFRTWTASTRSISRYLDRKLDYLNSQRLHSVHGSGTAGCEPRVEEVLQMARHLRALRGVYLCATIRRTT